MNKKAKKQKSARAKSKLKPLPPMDAPPGFMKAQQEKRVMMDLIQRKLANSELGSEEEINEMLAGFTGRPMSEIIAENEPAELTDYDRALRRLDEIHGDMSPVQIRKIAESATEIEPECVEAWLELAGTETTEVSGKESMPHLRRAIEAGRSRYADLIAMERQRSDGEPWLWGHVQARSFLEAMHLLASELEFDSQLEEAQALLEEILALNHGDNQGVRYDYFRCLISTGEFSRVDDLIEKYPDENSAQWLYLTALHRFIEAADRCDWKPPFEEGDDPPIPDIIGAFRELPAEYDEANAAFDRAFEANRFAPFFLGDLRSLVVDIPHYSFKTPEEGVICGQSVRYYWAAHSADLWAYGRIEHLLGPDPWSKLLSESDRETIERFAYYDGEISNQRPEFDVEIADHCLLAQWVRGKALGRDMDS